MAATTVDEEITLAPDDDDDDIVVSPVTVVTTGPSTEPCGAPPQLGKLDSKSSTQFSLSLSLTPTTISLSISFFSGVQPSNTYIIVLSNFQLQQDTNPMLSWTPCP